MLLQARRPFHRVAEETRSGSWLAPHLDLLVQCSPLVGILRIKLAERDAVLTGLAVAVHPIGTERSLIPGRS